MAVFTRSAAAGQTQPQKDGPTASLIGARQSFDRGDWAEADRRLRILVQTDPNAVAAHYMLAHTLFHENKPKDSLQAFTDAAKLRQPSATDLRVVSLDYVLLNDYDDADHWMQDSLKANPGDGESWYTMGRIRYTENRFADAVQSFQKALELVPQSVKAENNLGLAYEGLNEPDKAIAAYRQAIAWGHGQAPQEEQPLINLGLLLTDRNQFTEARTVLQQAEVLAPKDTRVHGALGRLYARDNNLPAAQQELEQAIAGDPANSGLHFQLGQILRKQGQTERGAAELQTAATLERSNRH